MYYKPIGVALIFLLLLSPTLDIHALDSGKKSIEEDTHGKKSFEMEAREIYDRLMCPICPGQTISQSNSGISIQMRDLVKKKLREGKTKEEILQFFAHRYGEIILTKPVKTGFNLVLWVLPSLLILLVAVVLYIKVRRWSIKDDAQTEVKEEISDLSDYQERLEKELERFD